MSYDYNQLTADVNALRRYQFIDILTIGKTVMGKDIPCIKIGEGKTKILLNGSHHGLEYITSAFLMRFTKSLAEAYYKGLDFFNCTADKLLDTVTLYVIPMINPDGVDIAIHGLDVTNPYHRQLISLVGVHSFHKVWQANVNGVDLNHNYDARWNMVVEKPAPTKYGGSHPESEPETKSCANFIRDNEFDMILAFHSQGREIFYDFDGLTGMRSEEIAEKMADVSGYTVSKPVGTAAYGGCKDWFIEEFGKEGFTIEMGSGKNPLPLSMLDSIYEENSRIILAAAGM